MKIAHNPWAIFIEQEIGESRKERRNKNNL